MAFIADPHERREAEFVERGTASPAGWNVPAVRRDDRQRRAGITEASVDAALADVTDAQLVEGLGWGADAAADGGFAAADVAAVQAPISLPAIFGRFGRRWRAAWSGPRVPRDPVIAVEDIVNAYLANEYRPDESTVCALDRRRSGRRLYYMYAWYLNSCSSRKAAVMAGRVPLLKFTGDLFATVWHGKTSALAVEQRDAVANWAWSAANLPPETFETMLEEDYFALRPPLMGNMTMLGLMPCRNTSRAVYALSAMPYPCNTILGFDQPWIAEGYVNVMLEAHKQAAGGLWDSLNFARRAAMASVIALAEAKRKTSLPTFVIPVVVASIVATSIAVIATLVWRSRRSAADRDDRDALSKLIVAGVNEFDDDDDNGGGVEEIPARREPRRGRRTPYVSRKWQLKRADRDGRREGRCISARTRGAPVAVRVRLKSLKHAEHEISIFRHLPRHENLVRLIGYTNIDSKWSLVMEYCTFHCLHQCLQTGDLFDMPGGAGGARKNSWSRCSRMPSKASAPSTTPTHTITTSRWKTSWCRALGTRRGATASSPVATSE